MSEGVVKRKEEKEPIVCPECQGVLIEKRGFFGERVLSCKDHGIVWGDAEEAEKLATAAEKMVDSVEFWKYR